ncbi:MAG: potassium transporter TrkG, partial [Nitrososphaeraceae archaeon]
TTGFQLVNLESISIEAKIILVIVMLIGGMAYSTAGGIKFDRLILAIRTLLRWNKQGKRFLSHPQSMLPPHKTTSLPETNSNLINKIFNWKGSHISNVVKTNRNDIKMGLISTTPDTNTMRNTVFIIILFPAVSLGAAIIISYFNGTNFFDTFFESVSAVTNTGLTSGITSMDLDATSKIILSINMIIGRFEIIAILYIFFNRFRNRTT